MATSDTREVESPCQPKHMQDNVTPKVVYEEELPKNIEDWQDRMKNRFPDFVIDLEPISKVQRVARSAEELLARDTEAHPFWQLKFLFTRGHLGEDSNKPKIDRIKSFGRSSKTPESWILSGYFELRAEQDRSDVHSSPFVPGSRNEAATDEVPTIDSKKGMAIRSSLGGRSFLDLWKLVGSQKQTIPASIVLNKGLTKEMTVTSTYKLHWAMPRSGGRGHQVRFIDVDIKQALKHDEMVGKKRKEDGSWSREWIRVQWSRV